MDHKIHLTFFNIYIYIYIYQEKMKMRHYRQNANFHTKQNWFINQFVHTTFQNIGCFFYVLKRSLTFTKAAFI